MQSSKLRTVKTIKFPAINRLINRKILQPYFCCVDYVHSYWNYTSAVCKTLRYEVVDTIMYTMHVVCFVYVYTCI